MPAPEQHAVPRGVMGEGGVLIPFWLGDLVDGPVADKIADPDSLIRAALGELGFTGGEGGGGTTIPLTGVTATAIIGGGALFTVTHGLASFNVSVLVYDIAARKTVTAVVTRPSTSTVVVDFDGESIPAASHLVLVTRPDVDDSSVHVIGGDDTFTLTHGLGSANVEIEVWENTGDRQTVYPVLTRISPTQVVVDFDGTEVDPASHTVMVTRLAAGGSSVHTIGDGVSTSFTLTHGLGTTAVAVHVLSLSDRKSAYPVITRPDADTVVVDFDDDLVPTAASHVVLVAARGSAGATSSVSLPARTTAVHTTGSLADDASEASAVDLGARSYRLMAVVVSRDARLRVYATAAARTADAARAFASPPGQHDGCYLDIELEAGVTVQLAPQVLGSTFDGTRQVPLNVTNASGSTGTVATTFTYQVQES